MLLIRAHNKKQPKEFKPWYRFFFLYLSAIILYAWQTPAYAGCTASACTCLMSNALTASLAFGSYSAIAAKTGTGTITVACFSLGSGMVTYTIALSAGNSGSFTTRHMTLSGHNLNYNLYTSAALSSVWGDGTGGSTLPSYMVPVTGTSASINYTVYGQIPSNQTTVPVGTNYTDSIAVTITW
jgi:spore coat protein U-like protein